MDASLLVAVLLAQAAPVPTAPPVIIEVKSRSLCTALRTRIQPSILGLITNDQEIETGRVEFNRMGMDEVQGSKALNIDRLHVENSVGSIVHNLAIIDGLLDDPTLFPASPKTDDERQSLAIKKQLLAIEDRQKTELNALSGIVATDELNSMQHEFPDFSPTVSGGPGPAAEGTAAPTNTTDAGLPSAPGTNNTLRETADTGLIGTTLYGRVATLMHGEQIHVAGLENAASTSIVSAAATCRTSPEPSSSPTP